MKITILYDNEASIAGLTPDWGFSCLIEAYGRNILFDTGENGKILLNNMKALEVNPLAIEEVFISHSHFDHSGGLSELLNINNKVTIYAPTMLRGIHRAKDVIYVEQPITIHEHFFSTGCLSDIEQSLVIETDKGLVIIVGCSHPGVKNILKAASHYGKPYALIGGFHGFDDYPKIANLAIICPTHCTAHKTEIKSLYPDKYISGGVGTIITI